jgi:hypothetical protein
MPFVVKSTGLGFSSAWLSPRSENGSYSLGPRRDAAIFPTDTEARVAIIEAAIYLDTLGFVFSVESAEINEDRQ